MCGIYGITAKDTNFVNQYIDKCSHRGPDGRGTWHDDTVTFCLLYTSPSPRD